MFFLNTPENIPTNTPRNIYPDILAKEKKEYEIKAFFSEGL